MSAMVCCCDQEMSEVVWCCDCEMRVGDVGLFVFLYQINEWPFHLKGQQLATGILFPFLPFVDKWWFHLPSVQPCISEYLRVWMGSWKFVCTGSGINSFTILLWWQTIAMKLSFRCQTPILTNSLATFWPQLVSICEIEKSTSFTRFIDRMFVIGCLCLSPFTYGFNLMVEPESARHFFRFLMCQQVTFDVIIKDFGRIRSSILLTVVIH